MAKGQKKPNTNLPVRESIVQSARERLRKISIFAKSESKNAVERFEKRAERERQRVIAETNRRFTDALHEAHQKEIRAYQLKEERKLQELRQRIDPQTPVAVAPPSDEKPKPEPYHGNWMKSDAFGTVLGTDPYRPDEDEDDFISSRRSNVRRIYGGNK